MAAAAAQLQASMHIGTPAQQQGPYLPLRHGQLSPQSSLSRSTSTASSYTQAGSCSPPCGIPASTAASNYLAGASPYGGHPSAPLHRMGSFPAAAAEMPGAANVDVPSLLQALSLLQQGACSSHSSRYGLNGYGAEMGPVGMAGYGPAFNMEQGLYGAPPEAFLNAKAGQGVTGAASLQGVLQLAQMVETLNREPSLANSDLLMGLINRLTGMVRALMQEHAAQEYTA